MPPSLLPPRGTRLSEDLARLGDAAEEGPLTMNRLLRAARGRGFPALLAILTLPFIIPLPLPGLSTPFGIAIALFGLRLAILRRPLLPRWLLRRKIPPVVARALLHRGVPIIRRAERWLYPRLLPLSRWPPFRSITGLAVASCGFVLALPVPIPFSNTLPAFGALLLALGAMEEDGLFLLLGWVLSLAAWIALAVLCWMGKIGLHHLLL